MSPIPASFSSQTSPSLPATTSASVFAAMPMYVSPSLTHLSVVGVFFLVLLLVLVTGTLLYCIYKCFAPAEDKKPQATTIRPFILSKLVSINGRAFFVKRSPSSDFSKEGTTAYTVNENGVKKAVRLYCNSKPTSSTQGSDVSSLPSPSSSSSSTCTSPPVTPSTSFSHIFSCDPEAFAALYVPTRPPPPIPSPVLNEVDFYANPKLFPVQGPIKRMETFHATSPIQVVGIAPPPAVYHSPISSRKYSGLLPLLPSPQVVKNAADSFNSASLAQAPVKSAFGSSSTTRDPSSLKRTTVLRAADLQIPSPVQAPIHSARVSSAACSTRLFKPLPIPPVTSSQTKPRALSVQASNTRVGTSANALTALSLASSKKQTSTDLKKKVNVLRPIKPLRMHPHHVRPGPRYRSVNAAQKTRVVHPGKENVPIAPVTPYYYF